MNWGSSAPELEPSELSAGSSVEGLSSAGAETGAGSSDSAGFGFSSTTASSVSSGLASFATSSVEGSLGDLDFFFLDLGDLGDFWISSSTGADEDVAAVASALEEEA